jgi:hypothetical protein
MIPVPRGGDDVQLRGGLEPTHWEVGRSTKEESRWAVVKFGPGDVITICIELTWEDSFAAELSMEVSIASRNGIAD